VGGKNEMKSASSAVWSSKAPLGMRPVGSLLAGFGNTMDGGEFAYG